MQKGRSTNNNDLDEAINKYVLIESGIKLSLKDINSYELELIPFIKGIHNHIQEEEMNKQMKNMPKIKGRR